MTPETGFHAEYRADDDHWIRLFSSASEAAAREFARDYGRHEECLTRVVRTMTVTTLVDCYAPWYEASQQDLARFVPEAMKPAEGGG